jgi:hypothetical protein
MGNENSLRNTGKCLKDREKARMTRQTFKSFVRSLIATVFWDLCIYFDIPLMIHLSSIAFFMSY